MKYFLSILFFFWATNIVAQTSCSCVDDKKERPQHIYKLSKNVSLGFCGFLNKDYKDEIKENIYVESYLFNCSNNQKIYEWWALQNCSIKQKGDTVLISEYYLLPIGDSLKLEWKPFFITKVFVDSNEFRARQSFLTEAYNYTQEEVTTILERYEETTDKTYEWNSLKYLDLCYQLFWCYVSGSEKALVYLKEADKRFKHFSGHVAKEYYDLLRTCEEIKATKKK